MVNPADIPTADKQNYQKTDKIDAKNLSKQLSINNLKSIHVPSQTEDFIRCLVRQRNTVVKQKRVVKNKIKSFLLFMGTKIPEEIDRFGVPKLQQVKIFFSVVIVTISEWRNG